MRRRPPREVVVAVVVALAVLGGAVATVLHLQGVAERHQRKAEALVAVSLQTALLSRLEWQAVAEGGLGAELVTRLREIRGRARANGAQTLGELRGQSDGPALERLLTSYLSSAATGFTLLAAGKVDAARRLNAERIDPAFDRLEAGIAPALARERSQALRTAAIAKSARILVVILALLGLGTLFWRLTSKRQAAREAFFDPLTGLANRMLVADRLNQALRLAERTGERVAVLFLDLDDFKRVNDTLGHAAGDTLLKEVAGRLRATGRSSDTIGRLGGDEFAIVLQGVADGVDAPMSAAARIFDQLTAPFTVAGHEVTMTASVGWAVSESGGSPAEDLLRNADLAMYAGKRQGKRCVVMYEPAMQEALSDRLQLEGDLREALARGEISVAYQPIVAVDGGRLRSLEALARWTHPERGAIGPALFIPLAEQAGMIQEIGRFVLLTATAELRRWQSERSFVPPIGVNVNVSPFQLQGGRIVDDVREALRESGIDPWTLTLEITESVLVDRGDTFMSTLEQLARLGVRLAIDDFGTGCSSLSTLGRFPIDTLKIDHSFIEAVTGPDGGLELVRSIVELGGRLGLDVVAEGIETGAQADILRELSCAFGQGYHYARPLAAGAVDAYLTVHSSPAPTRVQARRAADPAPHAPAIQARTT